MPARVVVSLVMLGVMAVGITVAEVVQRLSRSSMPAGLRRWGWIALGATAIFAAADVVTYVVRDDLLPRGLLLAKSFVLWVILLAWGAMLAASVVRYRSTHRPPAE